MRPRGWLLGAALLPTAVGCAAPRAPEASVAPASARTDADDVRIDLGPGGMAATIAAPREAEAHATPDGVELRGGPHFHLFVRRGSIDPLEEKAEIVREHDDEFRRFLRDHGHEVVYETSTLQGARFHFFFGSTRAEIPYHCRTPDEGVSSLLAVEQMLEACRHVHFRREIDPSAPATTPPEDSP